MPEAAPSPILGLQNQAPLNRNAVHIPQLFHALFLAEDQEIIKAPLPDVSQDRPQDPGLGRRSPPRRVQEAPRLQRPLANRIGDWRVVYSIDDAAKRVSISRIAHRREVYD
jgi:hypothetical protein